MADYAELMERHGFIPKNHEIPLWFDVGLNPIFDSRGQIIPGHQAVVRGDTGDTLAVHSDKYSLVPYKQHFEAFEAAIERSALDSTGMMVGSDMSDNGARIFRNYIFPAHTKDVQTARHSETVAFRIVMLDSYDGSTSFQGRCGFYNFVCANESICGDDVDQMRLRHVGDMEKKVEEAAERLTIAGARFIEQMERLIKWPQITLGANEFTRIVTALPQGNGRLTDQMVAEFSRSGSETLWDAHQQLTAWSTHGIPVKTKADRQKRVAALVEGDVWRRYEE